MNNNNQTKSVKISEITRKWHLFDVHDQILGRVATDIAVALMGKRKANFVRNLDCGDHVVVINARHVRVTGKKEKEKLYSSYSGFPGGLKQKPLRQIRQEKPVHIIRSAVYGMLPKNKLRAKLISRLYIFPDQDHTYEKELKGEK